jgi:hypothetical protein
MPPADRDDRNQRYWKRVMVNLIFGNEGIAAFTKNFHLRKIYLDGNTVKSSNLHNLNVSIQLLASEREPWV